MPLLDPKARPTPKQEVDDTPQKDLVSGPRPSRDQIGLSIVHECIQLARRIMFCDAGMRASASALQEIRLLVRNPRLGRPLPSEIDSMFEDCLNAVNSFKQCQTNVAVAPDLDDCAQVGDGKSTTIWLRSDVYHQAINSQRMLERPEASHEDVLRRQRHIFFTATLIAHNSQQIIRRAAVAPDMVEYFNSIFAQEAYAERLLEDPPVFDRSGRKPYLGSGGWLFERLIFGGHLGRIVPRWRGPLPDTYPGEITGLIVLLSEGGNSGYAHVNDVVIHDVVEGKEGWEQCLPLELGTQTGEFVVGRHPNASYRARDGSHRGEEVAQNRHRRGPFRALSALVPVISSK